MRSDDQILSTHKILRRSGVRIALDDFGTGFASLSTLSQLPVTRLKIDKTFVADLGLGPHGSAIISAIVSLARGLDLEVVAEGVETEEQRLNLLSLGCYNGQGYLFGRPTKGETFNNITALVLQKNVLPPCRRCIGSKNQKFRECPLLQPNIGS